jgi:hypothetical protein
LDTIANEARIKVVREDSDAPRHWKNFNCKINVSLYLNLFNANGGRINIEKFDSTLISGEVMSVFMSQVSDIMPGTRFGKTARVPLAFDPIIYDEMAYFKDKFPKYDDPADFSFQMCMFMMDWVKKTFKLNTADDVKMFMLYIRNSGAKDLAGVLTALEPLSRRMKE